MRSRPPSRTAELTQPPPLLLLLLVVTYSAPSFTTTAPFIKYPTYEEYSLAIEQSIDSKTSVSVTYVGNHGYHEPVTDGSRNLTHL